MDIFNTVSEYKYNKRLFKRYNDEKNNYYISYGGRQTFNIMSYLYDNSTIYLYRKYIKYINLKSTF